LTAKEIERELRLIAERLKVIDKETPEMSGMDWASEHGWISQEEWEAAGEKAKAGVILQDAEVEKIEVLRREHPQAIDEFLDAHLQWLNKVRDDLDRMSRTAKDNGLEFPMQFNLTLLPDIISCLKAWRSKTKPKHWQAWMWRVAFSIGEESEAFLRNKSS
jgi:hypothetical protein